MIQVDVLVKELKALRKEVKDAVVEQALDVIIKHLKQRSRIKTEDGKIPPLRMKDKNIAYKALEVIGDFFVRVSSGAISRTLADEFIDHFL